MKRIFGITQSINIFPLIKVYKNNNNNMCNINVFTQQYLVHFKAFTFKIKSACNSTLNKKVPSH